MRSLPIHFKKRFLMFPCLTTVQYRRVERSHFLKRVGHFLCAGFVVFVQAVVALAPGGRVLLLQLLAKVFAHQGMCIQCLRTMPAFGGNQFCAAQSVHDLFPLAIRLRLKAFAEVWNRRSSTDCRKLCFFRGTAEQPQDAQQLHFG